MAHNIFVLLQLLEYDRQESGMNIYNAGFPSKAGILFLDATICAKNEPLLFPTNISGCSWLHNLCIKSRASCGCKGKSGLKTVALPLKYSFKARAGIHVPDAKKP